MGSSSASPSTACSASQAQFAGILGWRRCEANGGTRPWLRDCVRRLLWRSTERGHGQPRGGASSYRYMVRTSHLCWQCSPPPAMRPARVSDEVALRYLHRWSRPELARSGGTGYSMQTIGQVCRWTGHQGTSCDPSSVSLRCWSLYLSTCNGGAGWAILQARLFAQPLASSRHFEADALYGAALHSCSNILFQCFR